MVRGCLVILYMLRYYYDPGLQVSCTPSDFVMGQTATCRCSSDMASTGFQWYRDNSSIPIGGTGTLNIALSTDSYGDKYTCSMSTACGDQQETITVGNLTGKVTALLTQCPWPLFQIFLCTKTSNTSDVAKT